MTDKLKPDSRGFAYVLRWMDFLHEQKAGADPSFVMEWRDFTRQAADAIEELTQKCNYIMRQHAERLDEIARLKLELEDARK